MCAGMVIYFPQIYILFTPIFWFLEPPASYWVLTIFHLLLEGEGEEKLSLMRRGNGWSPFAINHQELSYNCYRNDASMWTEPTLHRHIHIHTTCIKRKADPIEACNRTASNTAFALSTPSPPINWPTLAPPRLTLILAPPSQTYTLTGGLLDPRTAQKF